MCDHSVRMLEGSLIRPRVGIAVRGTLAANGACLADPACPSWPSMARRMRLMLSVWRLQLLREVASRGTIKAAAEAMFLSASAVFQQLTILEREVGTPLLAKNGRRVRVTDTGTLLAHHANIITAAISAAEADLAVSLNRMAGNLRVASFPIAAQTLMPNIISAVSKVYPSLRVALSGTSNRPRPSKPFDVARSTWQSSMTTRMASLTLEGSTPGTCLTILCTWRPPRNRPTSALSARLAWRSCVMPTGSRFGRAAGSAVRL